jgi:hypothetical protein
VLSEEGPTLLRAQLNAAEMFDELKANYVSSPFPKRCVLPLVGGEMKLFTPLF